MRTPLVRKRQPLRLPVLGEVWHTQTGRKVRVIDLGKPYLLQRQRLAPDAVIDLNMNLRNSALSEMRVTPRRLSLVTFNTLPHLGGAEHAAWVTHA